MTEEVCTGMEGHLGLSKGALAVRLRKAGRRLPRWARKAGEVLVEAEGVIGNPKLARQIDEAEVRRAHAGLVAHLKTIDLADQRRGRLIGVVSGLAFNLLVLLGIVLALLRWRGLV